MPGNTMVSCSGCGKEYELLQPQSIIELVQQGKIQFYCGDCNGQED